MTFPRQLATKKRRWGEVWLVFVQVCSPVCPARHGQCRPSRLARGPSAKMYTPFDRNQWLERNAVRRKEEWKSLHTDKLIRVSPHLRHKQQMGRLGTAAFVEAVDAYKSGGDLYASWSAKSRKQQRAHALSLNHALELLVYHVHFSRSPLHSCSCSPTAIEVWISHSLRTTQSQGALPRSAKQEHAPCRSARSGRPASPG